MTATGDLSAYTVYHYNYDTGEPMNEGARIVEAAISANREMVEERVRELLDDVPAKSLRNEIADTVERFTDEWLRGESDGK